MSGMKLKDKTAVLLIAEGYHEHEYWFPYYRFREEGANVITSGVKPGTVLGEGRGGKDGLEAEIEKAAADIKADDLDILFMPGGIYGPLELRNDKDVIKLVRECVEKSKLVCAICHAPWILVSADVVRGKQISCPSDMSVDVINAGATYTRDAAVRDGNIVTARAYPYLPEMFRIIISGF